MIDCHVLTMSISARGPSFQFVSIKIVKLTFPSSSLSHFYVGVDIRWHLPPCWSFIHFLPRQPLPSGICYLRVESRLRPSYPLHIHFYCRPIYLRNPYLVSLNAYTIFLQDFPHFCCPSEIDSYHVKHCDSAHPS